MKQKRTGHAEVGDEARPVVEVEEQELAVAAHDGDRPAAHAGSESARQRATQGLAGRDERGDRLAHDVPLEMATDGLDFRKLRHGCLPSSIEGGLLDHMIPRPGLIATLLLGTLSMAGADAHATEPTVDTILRRAPAE